jgi:hypothetical protein
MTTNNLDYGLFGKQVGCNYIAPGAWSAYLASGRLRFVLLGTDSLTSTEHWTDDLINDGQWHHFALVRAQTNVTVYLDGAMETGPHGNGGSTRAYTASLVNVANAAQFTMGGANGSPVGVSFNWCYQARNLGDQYDEVQFYNVALNAEQISSIAALQANAFGPPSLNITKLANAVRLTWTTNSPGYALQTNKPNERLVPTLHLMACSPLARSIVTEILISLVEIMPIFTLSLARVSNSLPATPVCDFMPTPTMESLPIFSSVKTSLKPISALSRQ